jgi:pimeloyl-ACP methyl ester carboxylesterase
MILRHATLLIAVCAIGCRAAPLSEGQRYPAGTPFRAQYRTIDGSRIRLIDSGTGTPVVFLHGFGASMYSWRKTLPVVSAAGYRVVAFDNRGWGFSDKPPHGYGNAAYTRLTLALLDSLRISNAVLVGHSMGATIVAEVALAHPDRVRGLVLMDGAGSGVRWPGVLKVARRPFVGPVATAFRGRWITARLLRSTYADPGKITAADVDQYYAPVPAPGFGRSLRGVLREFRFDNLAGRAGDVQAPTLVIWGEADRWIPLRDGSRLARELPRSAFVIIPRTGHRPAEESPDEVNQLLVEFLKQGLTRIPENVAWSPPPPSSLRCSRCSSPPSP